VTKTLDGSCARCRFWKRDDSGYFEPIGKTFGQCEATPMWHEVINRAGAGKFAWTRRGAAVTAFVEDAEDQQTCLYTKAEHGCSMFEPRVPA
jgi:hypothetical protein